MNYDLLHLLKCPLTKTGLQFKLIAEFEKQYGEIKITEIFEGLLFSETGFVFPIVDGIPRMLIESIYDYAIFLEKHVSDFKNIKEQIEKNNKGILEYCLNKNKKTKKSFEFEWDFLDTEKKDRIWHEDNSNLSTIFKNETAENLDFYKDLKVIDVGCGHGMMTSKIAKCSKIVVGIELSKAVENAYHINENKNAWYVEGDLQFLPFDDFTFDVLYSSGVIHHTNNTELSFLLIEPVIKKGGKICLWLYHPQKSIIHNLILLLRKFTSKLPLKLCYLFLIIFIFPFSYLIKKIKRKNAPNYREEIIDLLDQFTPEFRFEIKHDVAIFWLRRKKYDAVKITTLDQFGFSIIGKKQ